MNDKVRHFVQEFWRVGSYWGVAWLAWVILSGCVRFAVIELHNKQPGGYNAPEKVAVRRTLIGIGSLGHLAFMIGFFVQLERRKSAEQEREANGQQSST